MLFAHASSVCSVSNISIEKISGASIADRYWLNAEVFSTSRHALHYPRRRKGVCVRFPSSEYFAGVCANAQTERQGRRDSAIPPSWNRRVNSKRNVGVILCLRQQHKVNPRNQHEEKPDVFKCRANR
jgi:hypothetical protein